MAERVSRRLFLSAAGAPLLAGSRLPAARLPTAGRASQLSAIEGGTYDVAVIGAGVFGAWTAWKLRLAGQRVALLDAYGPGNSRSSSGGESRIIRMAYGAKEFYTRWSARSLLEWKALSARERVPLFAETGVLWLSPDKDKNALASIATLGRVGIPHEVLGRTQLEKRFPQIAYDGLGLGIFEPESGALMSRRAVQTVVAAAVADGVDYLEASVGPPEGRGRVAALRTSRGTDVRAGTFVFACGPWLAKIFPDLLGDRIRVTRQEVFFFGIEPGDPRFVPPAMPTWIIDNEDSFGMPDLEGRGFKAAVDTGGPRVDPDTQSRVVTPEVTAAIRAYVARRFPALRAAPITETRVCQYEYTSTEDFLVDRHPGFENVWLVGGGSGHGFKHGPALGEYVSERLLLGGPGEERFGLATKARAVG